jgi:biotin carboxyl carrier protein
MNKAIVNNKSFEIISDAEGLTVNGEKLTLDIARIDGKYFHVIFRDKSYRAEIVATDKTLKVVTVKINGRRYNVNVKNKFDLLLEKMGMQNGVSGKLNSIKAPMPGLIIELKVKDGDVVKQHDPLLILEAMKMENIIKAPGDGVVRHVKVQKGNSVEKNQVLIEF